MSLGRSTHEARESAERPLTLVNQCRCDLAHLKPANAGQYCATTKPGCCRSVSM